MAGLLRNLLTLLLAWRARARVRPDARLACRFWVTPFDIGLRVLKSDRYLQLVEAAQIDFLVRTGLFAPLWRGGVSFVNVSQLVKFLRPVAVLQRVRVETHVAYADQKCAYFAHAFFIGDVPHAEVLVKMKFKRGAVTVPPAGILGPCTAVRPRQLDAWNEALDAMR